MVVWAGDRERAWATEIATQAASCVRIAPRTNLYELVALVRRARIFIGSDTGPLHIAAAVGIPCIGLYGVTRVADCGPYGSQHVALQVQYQEGTRRERRRADNTAMCQITVEKVQAACDQILARTSRAVA